MRGMVLRPLALRPQVHADLGGDEQIAGSLRCEERGERKGRIRVLLHRRELERLLGCRMLEGRGERGSLLEKPGVREADAADASARPELRGMRCLTSERDAVDPVDLEEMAGQGAAPFDRGQLRPALISREIDVRHPVPRLADDGLREALADERERDRDSLTRFDDAANVEMGVSVREPVIGREEDVTLEAGKLLGELAIDLFERLAGPVAR